ncbi:Formyltetrahydrofolate deformylase [Sinomonas atrocyanea]|uniref:Formyltetrahydrofolate deformylase n=1 Tax=Sinomonas atrocyanea TaxID=37927 RepID=A0A126ZXY4_9MICC|nr:formyltetrahydrofolate deformylase [Sinomonas atrocyanea]AMM31817.1 Formyltetrahydrofolate deformylase [Sinomonas atrocyanea]GEB66410.1 formyltetrahydrofolate deformylase [Sinomonas atrocyanea]GGG80992.1 formyltetrahydrofolate deformylase [Sinomonas atrocyanea]
MAGQAREYVLTLDCAEGPGIVYAVSGFLAERGCDIVDIKQFGDRRGGHFFMRVHFEAPASAHGAAGADADADDDGDRLRAEFAPVAERFGMEWKLRPEGERTRVLLMVSKFGHCLNDLLFRARVGELPIEIVGVVSNHEDHRGLVEWHGIPYHHIPVTKETKPEAEAKLLALVDAYAVELVVLARYMQVLSDQLATKMAGRVINIHHSFLPSFKGAKPYHQAWERGVKTVGATAHYVNAELDEGPIIAQQVIDVDHTHAPEDLVAVGRDAECKALSNAVRWHCEGRVILSGSRTVVLR